MKKIYSLILMALMAGSMMAQEPVLESRPQRTPEEEALKQTTRLVRELGIKDSVRIDTIYRMHLKYALYRQKGLTRAQNMERMQAIYTELKHLLTPEEFDAFMESVPNKALNLLVNAFSALNIVSETHLKN